jgi:hypothetical protein
MTEAEWLKCTNPQPMLDWLEDRASERKKRLFAVGLVRPYSALLESFKGDIVRRPKPVRCCE